MALTKLMQKTIDYPLFLAKTSVPLVVFFAERSVITTNYPYLQSKRLYTMVDYFQDTNGDIMFHLMELDHYIKFEPGGFFLARVIYPN